MTDDKDTRGREARMKVQMFGAMDLPENAPWKTPFRMPPLNMLREAFSDPEAVAYLACNHCGFFAEIGRRDLTFILDQVNQNATGAVWDADNRAKFDGTKRFISACGCPRCSPVMAFEVVDIPGGGAPPGAETPRGASQKTPTDANAEGGRQ